MRETDNLFGYANTSSPTLARRAQNFPGAEDVGRFLRTAPAARLAVRRRETRLSRERPSDRANEKEPTEAKFTNDRTTAAAKCRRKIRRRRRCSLLEGGFRENRETFRKMCGVCRPRLRLESVNKIAYSSSATRRRMSRRAPFFFSVFHFSKRKNLFH